MLAALNEEVDKYLHQLRDNDARDGATTTFEGNAGKSLKRLQRLQVEIAQEVDRLAQSRSTMVVRAKPR